MSKRKERNVSGHFIAVYDGQTIGPFVGRENAIKEVKKIMPDPTEHAADIYHRVCQVKVKNLEITDGETQSDVSSSATEPILETEERTAL